MELAFSCFISTLVLAMGVQYLLYVARQPRVLIASHHRYSQKALRFKRQYKIAAGWVLVGVALVSLVRAYWALLFG